MTWWPVAVSAGGHAEGTPDAVPGCGQPGPMNGYAGNEKTRRKLEQIGGAGAVTCKHVCNIVTSVGRADVYCK